MQGDCLQVMKNIPDHAVTMVLSDLPYGSTRSPWDVIIPFEELWEQYNRILAPGGVVALTAQGMFTAKVILSNHKWFKYKIVWIKSRVTNFLNASIQPLRRHEDICIFYKGKATYNPQMNTGKPYINNRRPGRLIGCYNDLKQVKTINKGSRFPTDLITFEEELLDQIYIKTDNDEGCYHPNQKPVKLGQYLIRTYSNPGDIILDNTCGSGSFLVAAVMEGRNFIGIEKNENAYRAKNIPIDLISICNKRIREARLLARKIRL